MPHIPSIGGWEAWEKLEERKIFTITAFTVTITQHM